MVTDGTFPSRRLRRRRQPAASPYSNHARYDSYRRVTQVKKYPAGQQSDDPCQRVNYYYDSNPYAGGFTENGWGRVAVVEYGDPMCTGGKYRESYSYTSGGLPVKKKLWAYNGYIGTGELLAQWSYDNEGKMLPVKYPDTQDNNLNVITAGAASYTYDGFGNRLTQTAPAMNLTYNASNNRITSTGYTYDANGNLTATPELSRNASA